MSMIESDFFIFRYSLVEEDQHTLIKTHEIPLPKGKAVLCAIDKDCEFSLNRVLYSFVGFKEMQPMAGLTFPTGRYYYGKLAKCRKAHMGEKIPGDIIEHQHDDWVPITMIIDVKSQFIVVQKDYKFGTSVQIANAIQAGLRKPVLVEYNYRVFVEGKPIKGLFWEIIKDHNKLYRIQLKMISPNILETNRAARDALQSLQELFRQDEVDITLKNNSGNLQIPGESFGNYIDYIEEGEGSWDVTTEGVRGGKKKHLSVENTEMISLRMVDQDVEENDRQLNINEEENQTNKVRSAVKLIADLYAKLNGRDES